MIDKESLKKIAHLARLKIPQDQENSLVSSINEIISWVDKLKEVDTEGVEPLVNMSEEVNVSRSDEVKKWMNADEALHNAPAREGDFFKVPKIIE